MRILMKRGNIIHPFSQDRFPLCVGILVPEIDLFLFMDFS